MIYDTTVPIKLKKTQQWFASIITRPIDENSQMNPISPSGRMMEEESCELISPSPTLKPHQRIELYNQQYWWRLVNILQECFPLTVRLFGYKDFTEAIAVPYLVKYPPDTWSLAFLGAHLSQWVKEEYQGQDKQLVQDAVSLDYAFYTSFFENQSPGIDLTKLPIPGDISSLMNVNLFVQPWLHCFEFNYDLLSFRQQMLLQPVGHWEENDFPNIESGKKYFVLYRNQYKHISWMELSSTAYKILQLFKNGTSVDNICEWIETQDDATCEEAALNLQKWLQEWIVWHWLCTPNETKD